MPDTAGEMSGEAFRLIGALVAEYAGLYFAPERATAVASRLLPRLIETQSTTFIDYYHVLKYDGGVELEYAIEMLTNHETYFFRETAQLHLITRLASQSTRALRVLSAGCSTGEEPYGLAMLLQEAGLAGRVEIVGIDISANVIQKAQNASYGPNSFRGVDGDVVSRFFSAEDGLMRLSPRICKAASLQKMNLMEAESLAELGEFDAILCRNVLIYFSRESKTRAIAGLVSLLREGGYLFLGHSESLFDVPNALEMVRAGTVLAHRRPVCTPSS